MNHIRITIEFESERGVTRGFQDHVEMGGTLTEPGEQRFARELFEYSRVELSPSQGPVDVTLSDNVIQGADEHHIDNIFDVGNLFNRLNAAELWMEIQNTLYDVNHCLKQARAYREVEPEAPEIESWYSAHARKMFNLNAAALYLAKIQDLVVRLLFERFGGRAFIVVDLTDDDWQKELKMKAAKHGLHKLRTEGKIEESEYQEIITALNEPAKSPHQKTVISYRNRVAHGIRPSVDHMELGPLLQNREGNQIRDESGNLIRTQWIMVAQAAKAEYEFNELYAPMVDYLLHVKSMLDKLKTMPRFA